MRPSRTFLLILIFGLYLTLRGYHSRDGDQAYRLPLFLHQQDPTLYPSDPFIRAFEAFNPHKGSLAALRLASLPLGLSTGIFVLFGLSFAGTCLGIERLAHTVWPGRPGVGWVAVGLVLVAKAGNIGTNHLFEAMLLDRLMALALGWMALAEMVADPKRAALTAAPWIGLAGVIHPSLGLQLGAVVAGGWMVWSLDRRFQVERQSCLLGLVTLGLALIPTLFLMAGSSAQLLAGLSPEEFRLLSVDVQSPQHLMPHLWRAPQWYAWFAYFVVAALSLKGQSLGDPKPETPNSARLRLVSLIGVTLFGLALAYLAIEPIQELRVTLFQPFRLATLARGLALVIISRHVFDLWIKGSLISRCRAVLITVGLTGDRSMAVAACVEAMFLLQAPWLGLVTFAGGLVFLSKHDTESGHWPILMALGCTVLAHWSILRHELTWTPRRMRLAMIAVWIGPVLGLLAPILPIQMAESLAFRWRLGATPVDDVERIALWCRDHTSKDASFIAPPGPKNFRLWSERSLAFNRAASPYHAAGLADWGSRYRDHVGFVGSTKEFVKAYQADRHGFEARYDAMSDQDLADLARRQGASYIVALVSKREEPSQDGPLLQLHREGKYAVYHVNP